MIREKQKNDRAIVKILDRFYNELNYNNSGKFTLTQYNRKMLCEKY